MAAVARLAAAAAEDCCLLLDCCCYFRAHDLQQHFLVRHDQGDDLVSLHQRRCRFLRVRRRRRCLVVVVVRQRNWNEDHVDALTILPHPK